MLSRRAFVGRLAATAAAAGTVTGFASRAQARTTGGDAPSSEPLPPASAVPEASRAAPPWELVAPLQVGAPLGHDWTVAGLSAVQGGSCVLTVMHASGRQQRIHLCRNAGAPAGLVHTAAVDLVVMNGGAGDVPTDEGLAQAVAAVAHAVARNEGAARVPELGLLAHAERVQRLGASAQLR